jgi:selenocysteine-specific elongation factor
MKGHGVDELKQKLTRLLSAPERDIEANLLIPVDHAFSVKGHGTVVTGTILSGSIAVGDSVEVMPTGLESRVRSLQTFGAERESASAGDRVGMNVPDVDESSLSRGDYLCRRGTLTKTDAITITLQRNPLYKERITAKMVVSATIGMPSVTAEIVPFTASPKGRILMNETSENDLHAVLILAKNIAVKPGLRVLLIRTDLPPTHMRIVGSGEVTESIAPTSVLRRRTRTGLVSRIREGDVLVEGLASRTEIAERLLGSEVLTKSGVSGTIEKPFGTRGVVSVRFNKEVQEGEEVYYETLREEVLSFGH